MATAKKPNETLWTPPGIFSFPYLANVDSGRQYSDDAYKVDLLILKSIFKEKGKELQEKVLKVGREYFGTAFKLKGGKQRSPFKDTDDDEKIVNAAMKNCIQIRAKSAPRKRGNDVLPANRPIVIGPRKIDGRFPEWSLDQIRDIKGGDWGVLNVSIYPYDQSGGGVTFGLRAVQFWKTGEALGQGRSVLLETAAELEAEIEEAKDTDVGASEEGSDSIV